MSDMAINIIFLATLFAGVPIMVLDLLGIIDLSDKPSIPFGMAAIIAGYLIRGLIK